MDSDVRQRNRELSKKKKRLAEIQKRIGELDTIFQRIYEDNITGKLSDERFMKMSKGEIMKKILAFILSFVMFFSSGITDLLTVSAAEAESQLDNGIYSVPVFVRGGISTTNTYENRCKEIYRTSKIEAADGKYKVTLRLMGITDELAGNVKVAKEGVIPCRA